MNIENSEIEGDAAATAQTARSFSPDFARNGLERMEEFHQEMSDMREALLDIESLGGQNASKKSHKLIDAMEAFEPSITMIGQIKSGKTSLVNAMSGRPDLLPADVNPWTSVVTSLHLNTKVNDEGTIASFQFFDPSEWDHLVENGGRIGELSSRAGASDELEKVREQIAEMREKTKARLGRKFELLLGQTHNYRHLDDDLIQRYVCMGDDFEDEDAQDAQGQFADITKSADLYIDAPSLPHALCIRDTPGVNDTFMMREQITINALRGSRICVVVLSATQALSSMDMGLIRLISNVKSREVVIFVNRIDELANPKDEIEEIRTSILSTLANNNCPDDLEVVFGSAYWANMALQEQIDDLDPDSAAALQNYSGVGKSELSAEQVWDHSGLPTLFDKIGERIAEGEGTTMLNTIRKRAMNHLQGLKASSSIVSLRMSNQALKVVDPETLGKHLDALEDSFRATLEKQLDALIENYSKRIDQAHKRFISRALESLIQHLETKGENELWQYSPDGLRILLRSSYQSMRKSVAGTCDSVFGGVTDELTKTYLSLLSAEVDGFKVLPPSAPEFPPPVTLGQTIALDLQTSWWKGWWQRRKGYRAYADAFYELIEAETMPIINDLKNGQVQEIRQIALDEYDEFLGEQSGILTDVSHKSQISTKELKDLFGITQQEERESLFEILFEEFSLDGELEAEADADDEPSGRPARPTRPVAKTQDMEDEGTAA